MRYAKWLFLLAYACVFMACADKPGRHGILSVDKMKLVMWDIMLVDDFMSGFMKKDSTLDIPKESGKRYQQVFGLHKVSEEEFYKSFQFYRQHPTYFKVLLDSMTAYGSRLRDSGYYSPQPTIQKVD